MINVVGEVSYIVSARHVVTATENMFTRFMESTLKVGKGQFKLINLLAKRNHPKGKNSGMRLQIGFPLIPNYRY